MLWYRTLTLGCFKTFNTLPANIFDLTKIITHHLFSWSHEPQIVLLTRSGKNSGLLSSDGLMVLHICLYFVVTRPWSLTLNLQSSEMLNILPINISEWWKLIPCMIILLVCYGSKTALFASWVMLWAWSLNLKFSELLDFALGSIFVYAM